MWKNENPVRYVRSRLRYPSDLTDEEFALVEPIAAAIAALWTLREVVNGLMYILSTGSQWRAIPKDLLPRSTVHDYFDLWSWDGTLDRIHDALYIHFREQAELEPSPTAAIIFGAFHALAVDVSKSLQRAARVANRGWRGSTRTAMMQARRSNARSATFSSTRRVCRWTMPQARQRLQNLNRKALAFLRLASIRLMQRKLCDPGWFSRTDTKTRHSVNLRMLTIKVLDKIEGKFLLDVLDLRCWNIRSVNENEY
jgi:transposase